MGSFASTQISCKRIRQKIQYTTSINQDCPERAGHTQQAQQILLQSQKFRES